MKQTHLRSKRKDPLRIGGLWLKEDKLRRVMLIGPFGQGSNMTLILSENTYKQRMGHYDYWLVLTKNTKMWNIKHDNNYGCILCGVKRRTNDKYGTYFIGRVPFGAFIINENKDKEDCRTGKRHIDNWQRFPDFIISYWENKLAFSSAIERKLYKQEQERREGSR